ncbi:hypothetical protein N7448_001163 [Penicillium atrosanguineum]|uniref:FAD-binding domain-containing protein n=1 Tax=Penicillium atrosanguineum TaxID=1132637 RepID=A0A9W9Q8R1_9EURO|nr:uncharacterized protein N7443_004561 [Penicillium atrosanguineum]KAJ5133816.1 hypothetical protein N7526_005181 [Penicillium atrosanguineum]KAJ5149585.1 hypothetical protein N7448_001163 [Penicillium atrosanguineum]KAJ5304901.1 hypothetical protein N7443_004561 [Penicillium atrosanguineum]KAJ5324366.1 hypothetical protein N7476_002966 [Penicillium atrosanguineum]
MAPLRIAIVGAGPVGLTLARLLLNKPNIEVTVFESETSRDSRGQGGSLDLHTTTGLAAVKEAGLYDEFLKNARFDGEALVLRDKHLTKYISFGGTLLREMLLDSVLPEIIRWGYHLQSIDENYNLIFDQNMKGGFNLIVGSEGAWSKTRKLLSDQMPNYAGITGIRFTISKAKETAPECYNLTNRGSVLSYFNEGWMDNLPFDLDNTEAVKKAIREIYKGWHPDLLNCVGHSQSPLSRRLYMLPVGWSWKNRPGFTLIGDSAHIMTLFAGEGVNLGIMDALMLSRAIIKISKSSNRSESLMAEIKTVEKGMFMRAERTATLTNDMMTWLFFTENAPRSIIEKLAARQMTFHNRSLLMRASHPLVVASVHTHFFWFKAFH